MKLTDEQIWALLGKPGFDVAALAQACRQLMTELRTEKDYSASLSLTLASYGTIVADRSVTRAQWDALADEDREFIAYLENAEGAEQSRAFHIFQKLLAPKPKPERSPLEKLVLGHPLTTEEQASLDKETAQLQRHATPDASASVDLDEVADRLSRDPQMLRIHLRAAQAELDRLARELATWKTEAEARRERKIRCEELEQKCDAAEAELTEVREERKDWARRFRLNDVTPWDWMTRAKAAEAELARARELLRDAYSLINACPVPLVGDDSLLEAIDRVLRDDR